MTTRMTEHTVADYVTLLEESNKAEAFLFNREVEHPLEFLGRGIFGFDTDDSGMDAEFATLALKTCKALTQGTTYELIAASERDYVDYLLMMNLEFFKNKTSSGTSIRGSWWEHGDIQLETSSLWTTNYKQIPSPIIFSRKEWLKFVYAMLRYGGYEMDASDVEAK